MYVEDEYLKPDYCALFGFRSNLAQYCALCPFLKDKDNCPRAYALFAVMMRNRMESRNAEMNGGVKNE